MAKGTPKINTHKPIEERTSLCFTESGYPENFRYIKDRAVRERRKSLAEMLDVILHEQRSIISNIPTTSIGNNT